MNATARSHPPELAELAQWHEHWTSALNGVRAGGNLSLKDVGDGIGRGGELLLDRRDFVLRWLDWLPNRPSQSAGDGLLVPQAFLMLNRLIDSIDGVTGPVARSMLQPLQPLARRISEAAGIATALPPSGSPAPPGTNGDMYALRLAEMVGRLEQERNHIKETLGDEQGPPYTHAYRAAIATAIADGNSSTTPYVEYLILDSSNTFDWDYWSARLLTLEMLRHDSATLLHELKRGRQLITHQLEEVRDGIVGDMGQGVRDSLILARTSSGIGAATQVIDQLAALDVNLPREVAELRLNNAGIESEYGYAPTEHLGQVTVLLENVHSALTTASEAGLAPLDDEFPRPPLHGLGNRWRFGPELSGDTVSWRELRPFLVGRAESLMETADPSGPELAASYLERINWVIDNVGPIAGEISGTPFDVSGLDIRAVTTTHHVHDAFLLAEAAALDADGPLDLDSVVALLELLDNASLLESEYDPAESPRRGVITVNARGGRPWLDPNQPESDAEIALKVVRAWRHHRQAEIAGGPVHTDRDRALRAGEAEDFALRVLLEAGNRGALDSGEVNATARRAAKDLGNWRSHNARLVAHAPPIQHLAAVGLVQNRAVTLGLAPTDKQAALEHIMANPELGPRAGESPQELGLRMRDELAPDQRGNPPGQGAASADAPGSGNSARIWRKGTRVEPPSRHRNRSR